MILNYPLALGCKYTRVRDVFMRVLMIKEPLKLLINYAPMVIFNLNLTYAKP